MPSRFGRLLAVFAVAALLAGLVGSAQADIDPASDVLPLQNVFLPYKPKVCSELSNALRKLTATAKNNGYPVKVAVIGSKGDLGGAAYLFGKPTNYAQFLAQELITYSPDFGTTYGTQPLLVAMPSGFGVINGGRGTKPEEILKQVPIPSGAGPNELVRSSLNAIPKLAKAAGHPVATPVVGSSCSKSGGGTSVLIFVAPIAVLLVGGLLAGARLRPRRSEG
jgi:hypothetical protein